MATPAFEYEFESEALPELEAESAGESLGESVHELSPIRRSSGPMMEHMAHMVAEAESEQELRKAFCR